MDFYTLIKSRESVRHFNPDKKVEKEKLLRILDAGRLAPSAANFQPWKFIVVSEEKLLAEVKSCYGRDWLKDAPHILIVMGDKTKAWTRAYDGYNSIETDLTIAMDHLILAAEFEGVGTCWIEAYDPAKLRKALDLDENEMVFSITPLGYSVDGYQKGEKKRKALEEVVEWR
ncbi:MAG: nitroreductase family protein [Bacteroidales bacterium]|nr:nitroreductase family protein [Bacteroidales bacterium]MCF8455459.1 nitroreductase family protein [Bacteroidales bacterium]